MNSFKQMQTCRLSLKPMVKVLTVALASLLLALPALAQSTITGHVVDQQGEPIVGASVTLKGTNNGVVTDLDGNFGIHCEEGSNLLISYIGYLSQTVKATPGMEIILKEDAKNLDELVVVGYGYMKKSDLTGSVSQLKSDDLMKNSPVSLEKGMQGRLAGVNVTSNDGAPGGGISIQIRGTSTFQGSGEPLYVIDGVPMSDSNDDSINFDSEAPNYSNALASLNPNDIASIEILKDASATAIYGSRGANGVVLITTKSGEGLSNQVSLSYKSTFSQPVKKIKVLTAAQYAEYRNQSYINTQEVSNFEWSQADLPFPGMYSENGTYLPGPEDLDDTDNYYWQDQVLRNGLTHDLNLSITGQNKNYDYAFSAGYTSQEGIVKGSDYTRYSTKLSLNNQLKPWLKIGASLSMTYSNSSILKTTTSNKNNGTEGIIRSAITYPASYTQDDYDNEYSMVALPSRYVDATNQNRNMTIRSSNYMNVTLAPWLMYRMVIGFNYNHNDANKYWPTTLAEGRDVSGKASAGDNWRTALVFDNLLMLNKTFDSKHNINATVGTSWEKNHYYSKSVTVQGFGSDLTNGWLLQDASTVNNVSSSVWDSQLFSLIGRIAYNYDGKYYLTVTARDDMSSKFAKGKRSSFFPSVGLSYRISNEEFMRPLNPLISNLKLRYSYGASGNQGISSYQTYAIMASSNYPFGTSIANGYVTDTYNPGNSNLTWETTWQHDGGIELELFNRLNIEADYYHKKTSDLLQYRQMPPSTGLMQMMSNLGAVINQGWEFNVRWTMVNNKDLMLAVGGNLSFNTNKVTDFQDDPMFPNSIYNSLRPYAIANGHAIGSFYGFVNDGIWNSRDEVVNGNQFKTQYPDYNPSEPDDVTEEIIRRDWIGELRYVDRDGDGFITDNDQDWIGNANPDFFYGFNLDLTWKNFDFSILFQGVKGNDILNMNAFRYYNIGDTQNKPVYIYEQSWSVNPDNAVAPKNFYYSGRDVRFSRLYLEDGSYLKLRTLSIGYTFRNLGKYIQSLRLNIVGNNLLTFTHYHGYDPEVNSFGSSPTLRGIDSGAYPQQRSFTFGLNVVF
ncbi:MAG: TonB-dependent receptor [Bacteroidales bacterium]|nr:TonB-dependent receptor [Bacteroidales bacterium]